jgi:hypothetical protein
MLTTVVQRTNECRIVSVSLSKFTCISSSMTGVRLEWCKARAHKHRLSEEVELLLEEMRHVLVFLKWQAA